MKCARGASARAMLSTGTFCSIFYFECEKCIRKIGFILTVIFAAKILESRDRTLCLCEMLIGKSSEDFVYV